MNGAGSWAGVAVVALCVGVLSGCSEKADEGKPMSEVKAEAEKLDTDQLRAKVLKYKEAIVAKAEDIAKLKDELKDTPVTEALGDEAKKLNEEVAELAKSLTALKQRFEVYYTSLKDKKGDLSGLEL